MDQAALAAQLLQTLSQLEVELATITGDLLSAKAREAVDTARSTLGEFRAIADMYLSYRENSMGSSREE